MFYIPYNFNLTATSLLYDEVYTSVFKVCVLLAYEYCSLLPSVYIFIH
jgi:hypothetical protein